MSITSKTLETSIKSNIQRRWPWAITEASRQLIDAYAEGLGIAFYKVLAGLTFSAGTVTGGVAPAGGTVIGALLTYSPGSLASPDLDLEAVFVPPQVKITTDNGTVLTGSYTPWLRCFTSTLSSTVKNAWLQFTTTWTLPGLACVGGGIAGWVASTPPVPGPWVNGTITTPFVFTSASTGVSGYVLAMLPTAFDAAGRAATVTIPIQASDPVTVNLIATDEGAKMAKAISGGFADTMSSVLSSVTVYDPSGSGGSGIAAPGGIVTGTLVGAKLNLAA